MAYAPNKSLRKAFGILECLNEVRDGLTASEVSRRAGIPSATAHRILKEMVGLGYLQCDRRTRAYSVGFGLTLFGNKRLVIERIVERARPILRSLAQQSRLTAYLGSLEGTQIIVEDRALYDQQTKLSHAVGAHLDAHAHSIGKVLLALLPEREIVAIYEAAPMQAHTRKTIRTSDRLLKNLREITVNGYALDDEELTMGVSSVATALVNPRGRAMCAIALEGPKHRAGRGNTGSLASLLMGAAKAVMEDVIEPASSPDRTRRS
jgi:IclR family acetate operon transcriptional repressor